MQQLLTVALSAAVGSAISLATVLVASSENTGETDNKTIEIEHVEKPIAKGVLYGLDDEGTIAPLDFRETASSSMDAVVHITSKSTVNTTYGNGSLSDPFERFFQQQFNQDFFGPHFRFHRSGPQKQKPQVRTGTGSGVIINENGYIVTNNHVIDNADEIEVTLHDKRSYKAIVVGTDPSTDLALLQIEEKNLPTVPLVNSDEVEVGEWVLAIGNPYNLNSTVTAGIVSAKGRNINILKDKSAIESFIQTDAAINPGNSGGALVNLDGGLVGINTAISSPTGSYTGYGFAVPSNIVNKVVEDLLKYGIVQRAYLGVMIKPVDGNLADEEELEVLKGVFVDSLIGNSAAKDAGLKQGDVILSVDGHSVNDAPQLQELIGQKRPGDKVKLQIDRRGKPMEVNVKLNNSNGETKAVKKEKIEMLSTLGVELRNVDRKLARKLDITGGVEVTELLPGKLKRHTTIQEGFIITKVNSQPIKTKDDFLKALENANGGVLLEGVYEDLPGAYYYAFGM